MTFKYLGTAASEGYPAVFCDCDFCNAARAAGERRSRSQALVNDELLVDLPPDTYAHALTYGLRLGRVKYLLITHSHGDHFYPNELTQRGGCFATRLQAPTLTVLASSGIVKAVQTEVAAYPPAAAGYAYVTAQAYTPVTLGDYTVVPLPARHMDGAYIYAITHGGKTLLYGNDTGYFYEEVFDYIKTAGLQFDMLSLDCTMCDNPVPDTGTHMGYDTCRRTAERLKDIGALKKDCRVCITHFSHNGNPSRANTDRRAKDIGATAAFDGMEIEI
ncbi:MAG: hypothetical protein LBM78_03635 [Clostridiales bacterium]|jgi:phosphoribosyl 1,2-cyclic phosphate phosphodiesterase|nr:hypothetical protein [Clostridiales bacterium]